MDDLLQPRGASREGGQDVIGKALGEDLPSAGTRATPKASYDNPELDAPAAERQVGGTAPVAALDATRRRSTIWAGRHRGSRSYDQTDPVGVAIEMIDDETSGYEARRPEAGAHAAAPSWMSANSTPLVPARVSQSPFSTPILIQPMAARADGVSYDRLHHFIAAGIWDEGSLQRALLGEADRLVGGADAVLVTDDTALPKKGNRSVGVAPQYATTLGKTANC